MAIKPTQPQSIGAVLDTAFQLYKTSIGKVLPLSAILAVSSLIPYLYIFFRTASSLDTADPTLMAQMMLSPGYWLAVLGTMVLSSWAMAAMYARVDAIARDDSMTNGAALGIGSARLLTTLITILLFSIALMLGIVALVIPGLILMVSLIFSLALVVVETKNPIDALASSHKLVWGHWWRTAAILTIGFIVFIVLYFAVMFVIGLIMPFVITADPNDVLIFSQVIGLVIGAVMSLLVGPFYCALLLAVYYDLKLRKEGGDLAARVGALNAA